MAAEKYKIQCYKAKLVRERTITVSRKKIAGADDSIAVVKRIIGDQITESVLCLWLNASNDLIGYQEISRGGLHACAMTPRDVLAGVIMNGASAFVLAHNHPSGDSTPSSEDVQFTNLVNEAARLMGITLLDHVIVTPRGGKASSFTEIGLL